MFNMKRTVHVVKYRILWICLSACLLTPGIIAMIYSMITYPTHSPVKVGIDYTGGTILQYGVKEDVKNDAVAKTREDLSKIGVDNPYIQILDVTPTEENKNINSIISIKTKFIDEGSDTTDEITQAIPQNLHLTVTSYNRRVLLTGEVGSQADKLKAQQIAQNSLEVSSVVNELMVGEVTSVGQRMSDSTLATKVRTQLVGTSGVSLNQMKVVVDRGIVYLMGLVTQEEANKAADVASRVSDVKSVIKVFEILTPQEVQERMKLVSNPNQSTSGSENSDGTVTLQ